MASKRLSSPKLKSLISTRRTRSPESDTADMNMTSEAHVSSDSYNNLSDVACSAKQFNVSNMDVPVSREVSSRGGEKVCTNKKRGGFFKFISKKKSTLSKYAEVEERGEIDEERRRHCEEMLFNEIVNAADDVGAHLRLNMNASPVRHLLEPDDDDISLRMGATTGRGVRSGLLQLVPPSAEQLSDTLGAAAEFDTTCPLHASSLQVNQISCGLSNVNISHALSSSSSSTSSSSATFPNLVADQSATHTLVSTIYPQIDSVRQCIESECSRTYPAPCHMVHTQVDYQHCLVPDLLSLTNSSCYWGVMDRYEAEQLLDNQPEGTFLVRDSAQEEFLFSVSFRRYGRSLHARIEQWNHCFTFDCHDLGVFYSPTVCGLIEHYKDPNCCMFFEPMLTHPLRRKSPFTLQHLCRAVVTSRLAYDDINCLQLPKSLLDYLKYYHYKQRVCVRRF